MNNDGPGLAWVQTLPPGPGTVVVHFVYRPPSMRGDLWTGKSVSCASTAVPDCLRLARTRIIDSTR